MKQLRNPILFYIFCIATIANIWDLVTSILIGTAESNPLFILFGNSIVPLIVIKILIVSSFWWFYTIKVYKTNFTYYFVISIMVLFTFLVLVASSINTYGLTQPEVMKVAVEFTMGEKVQQYSLFVGLGYVIPMLFNLLVFWVYDKSRKNIMVLKE